MRELGGGGKKVPKVSVFRGTQENLEEVKTFNTLGGSGEGGVKGEGSEEARGLGVGEVGVRMRRWGCRRCWDGTEFFKQTPTPNCGGDAFSTIDCINKQCRNTIEYQ
jgi:hypothetical protein